jgi:cytochrome c biogenesis factor
MIYKSVDYKRDPIILVLLIVSVLLTIVTIIANFIPVLTQQVEDRKYDYYNRLFIRLLVIILNVFQVLYFGKRYFYIEFVTKTEKYKCALRLYLAACLIALANFIFLVITNSFAAAFWIGLMFLVNITFALFYLINCHKCKKADLPK